MTEKLITLKWKSGEVLKEVVERWNTLLPRDQYNTEEAVEVMAREVAVLSMLCGAFFEGITNQPGSDAEFREINAASVKEGMRFWFELGQKSFKQEVTQLKH